MRIVSVALAALICGGVPAAAQYAAAPYPGARYAPEYGEALPPYEIMTIVRSMGFDPASRPALRGPFYVMRAYDDDDMLVRITVDARSGVVVRITEMTSPVYAGVDPGLQALPSGSALPVPPVARAPAPKAAARVPLPRPAPVKSAAVSTPAIPTPNPAVDSASGKSIPAPVARSAEGKADVEVTGSTAKPATKPEAGKDKLELAPTVMVPVAPLE